MEFSCRWLADYVDLELPAREAGRTAWEAFSRSLAGRLTSIGHAVEGERLVEDGAGSGRFDDLVLEVDVTGNRPDCMCHVGLAREIAASLDRPLTQPSRTKLATTGTPRVKVTLEDPSGCPRYVAVAIDGVRIGPSPAWLKERLAAIGQRSINNVVDVTNFVLWETGQPLHAFDLARLAGGEIRVRRARVGEKLTTLDGVERELDGEVLVIADAERAVALAGIMGGLASEVTGATTSILLESAHFDRRRVRRGAKALGMHTDASHRFERGTDPEAPREAAARAVELLLAVAGGVVVGPAVDAVGDAVPKTSWWLESARLDAFAGVAVPEKVVEQVFARLGFAPQPAAGGWEGTVPGWRHHDFTPREVTRDGRTILAAAPQDLYEEVLRLYGLDKIPATLPSLGAPDAGGDAGHARGMRVRRHLAACGLAEAIHYAFHDLASDAAYASLVPGGEPLALANPLSERYAVMRRSLVPGLVATAGFNARRGAAAVRLFEVGHLFPSGEAAEVEAVGLVVGGRVGEPWDRHAELDLFDLKGMLESLAADAGVALVARPARLEGFVPGTAGELLDVSGSVVGQFGQIAASETPFPLFAGELRTDALAAAAGQRLSVELPSRLPAVAADLTLTHALEVGWSEMERALRELAVPDLASFRLKDRYRGAGVPAGAVNTTIAFLYSAADRTLTQEEVNERQSLLAAELQRRFGWRGEEER